MPGLSIPPALTGLAISDLSRDQILEILESNSEGGIKIAFAGKSNARRLARAVRPRVSRTITKYGAGSPYERSKNVLIEGDNLQAMTTLYKERGHVDLILTDPPYNTGKDKDFRYNDKWDEDPNDPGIGDLVGEDDGARHTKWMKFMWPRLLMMKAMLKPNGVLAICIDHRELFHLGQMLDEVFRGNRLGIINWQKSYSPRSDNKHISTATEYVLVYAKDKTLAKTGLLPRTDAMNARYGNPDGDTRLWKAGDATGPGADTHQKMVYGVQSPFTGDMLYPTDGGCWRSDRKDVHKWLEEWGTKYVSKDISDDKNRAQVIGLPADQIEKAKALVLAEPLELAKKRAQKVLEEGPWPRFFFGVKGTGRPQLKNYLESVKQGKVPLTFWADEEYELPVEVGPVSWPHKESGHSQTGIDELDAIVGPGHQFTTVKPLRLFTKIIQLWCPSNGVVLDPFAGSGTTGHAVLALNAATGTNRRFICVEQGRPERGDSYAKTLTADRLRRAISGEWAAGPMAPTAGGFTFLHLGKNVDAAALLKMEREEMVDTVIASHFDATRRRGDQLINVDPDGIKAYRYLVAKNSDNEGFFLVWDGPDENIDFTESVYDDCAKEAALEGVKPAPYHVYARLYRYQTEGIRFYQIPDRILADFGLDLKNEPFAIVDDQDEVFS